MPRKKMQSAVLPARFRVEREARESSPPQNAAKAPGQLLQQMLLPRLAVKVIEGTTSRNAVADLLIIATSYLVVQQGLASIAKAFALWRNQPTNEQGSAQGLAWSLLFAGLFLLFGYPEGLYRQGLRRDKVMERVALCKTALWATLVCSALLVVTGRTYSLRVIALSSVLNLLLMNVWRDYLWTKRIRLSSKNERQARNILVVGAGKFGREIADQIQQDPWSGKVVRGFLDDREPLGGDVLGRFHDLPRIARAQFIDEIVLAIPHQRDQARWLAHVARSKQLDVKLAPDLLGFSGREADAGGAAPPILLPLHTGRVPRMGLLIKRTLDVTLSAIALLTLAPAAAAIALAIKLNSRGPILYCAARMGKKGRTFVCYKFRTMVADADTLRQGLRVCNERNGACFKLRDDPRVTPLGRFLRRYSLDELPQFWNVLKGEMSLVGPRPHPLDDFQRYELDDLRRLDVTPGITGLWQVTARSDPSFERNIELDVEYIQRWNLRMDVKILCKTVSAVLQGSGA